MKTNSRIRKHFNDRNFSINENSILRKNKTTTITVEIQKKIFSPLDIGGNSSRERKYNSKIGKDSIENKGTNPKIRASKIVRRLPKFETGRQSTDKTYKKSQITEMAIPIKMVREKIFCSHIFKILSLKKNAFIMCLV